MVRARVAFAEPIDSELPIAVTMHGDTDLPLDLGTGNWLVAWQAASASAHWQGLLETSPIQF